MKKELPCLSHVVLIGDRRKFLSCLVTLKLEVGVNVIAIKAIFILVFVIVTLEVMVNHCDPNDAGERGNP